MIRAGFRIATLAATLGMVALRAQSVRVKELSATPSAAGERVLALPEGFRAVGGRSEGLFWPAGIRIRVSPDRIRWSDWQPLPPDPDHGGQAVSRMAFFEHTQRWLEWDPGQEAASLRFIAIDPGDSPPDATRGKPGRALDSAVVGVPRVVSRFEWGCPDAENRRGPRSFTAVTHFIVHHTADNFQGRDYAAWVRAIWAFHVNSNGWVDTGYNYLIDPEGTVYEGRGGGDGVLGAHFSCQNANTLGVALLGTYTLAQPPLPAFESLRDLLAWRAAALGIDPAGRSLLPGMQLTMDHISSHRDGNTSPRSCTVTECPGSTLYGRLGELREAVKTAAARTLLLQDAESGMGGWRSEGSGLWHVSERRASSPGRSFWYGREATGDYDLGGGQAHSGWLTSPEVLLTGGGLLRFRSWHDTEDDGLEWDRKLVEVSVDGGGWETVARLGGTAHPAREWNEVRVELPVRGRVRVRFRFDTVDASLNRFGGWFVDDISLSVN